MVASRLISYRSVQLFELAVRDGLFEPDIQLGLVERKQINQFIGSVGGV